MQSATKMIITAFSVLSLPTGALAGVNRIFVSIPSSTLAYNTSTDLPQSLGSGR